MSSGSNFSNSGFGGGPTFTHSLTNRESTKPGHVAAAAARRLLPGSKQAPGSRRGAAGTQERGWGKQRGNEKGPRDFSKAFFIYS